MFTYTPRGVCSSEIHISIDNENRIKDVRIYDGCPGNLAAIAELCKGQKAQEVISKLRGIRCGTKRTSCPDQLSYAIEGALSEKTGLSTPPFPTSSCQELESA